MTTLNFGLPTQIGTFFTGFTVSLKEACHFKGVHPIWKSPLDSVTGTLIFEFTQPELCHLTRLLSSPTLRISVLSQLHHWVRIRHFAAVTTCGRIRFHVSFVNCVVSPTAFRRSAPPPLYHPPSATASCGGFFLQPSGFFCSRFNRS